MRKVCGIYKITHIESGLTYIGQSKNVFERLKRHSKGDSRIYISTLLKDEGVDRFVFSIVEECSENELNSREKWWIEHLDCVHPKGYNMTSGGDYTTVFSEESRQKMSEARMKKWQEESYRELMTSVHRGKTHSIETKQLISEKNRGRTRSEETRKRMSETAKERHKRQRVSE